MKTGSREELEPVCPFCGAKLARPAAVKLSAVEEALGGTCRGCGAIYLVDPTNKNVGEVMMQTLGLAADKLAKDMSEMIAGQDYEDAVLNYDVRIHRSSGVNRGFADGHGRLYILKIKKQTV